MPKPSLHVIRGCYECPLQDRSAGMCDHPEAANELRASRDAHEHAPDGCPLRTGELRIALTMSDDLRVGEREAQPLGHDRLTRAERALAVLLRTSGARIPLQSNEKVILREFLEGIES